MINEINLRWVKIVSLLSMLSFLGCLAAGAGGKSDSSGNKDGSIVTPLGSLSIKTEGHTDEMGVKLYPGATLRPDTEGDRNSSNASINVATSLFGMKLIVQKYESDDPPDKLIAFYEKELAKFGKVIRCEAGSAVAPPESHKKDAPVSCDKIDAAGDDYKTELKVGTERNQHIAAIKPHGKGTSFALVYVHVRGGDKD